MRMFELKVSEFEGRSLRRIGVGFRDFWVSFEYGEGCFGLLRGRFLL